MTAGPFGLWGEDSAMTEPARRQDACAKAASL